MLSQGSLFVRSESIFDVNNTEWAAASSQTVRENAVVREDDNDCQSHSHLYADDVVEIIDVRISETSVSGMLTTGGWILMGVLTQTSQKDDANIPYFLHYNDTHVADTIGVDLGQTRLEFLPYCQILRTNITAVSRIVDKIMTVKSDQQSESIMEDDKFRVRLTLKLPFRPGGLMTGELERKFTCGSKQNSGQEAHSDVAIRPGRGSDEQHPADFRPPQEASRKIRGLSQVHQD